MNIYAKEGDKIVFCNPNNGYPHQRERAAEHLVINAIYTVDHTDVR